jgi:hypothetical protein
VSKAAEEKLFRVIADGQQVGGQMRERNAVTKAETLVKRRKHVAVWKGDQILAMWENGRKIVG